MREIEQGDEPPPLGRRVVPGPVRPSSSEL
jgi:hypothetical protein